MCSTFGVHYTGTCGDNLTWQLTKDGVLTISGTGNMYDYTSTTQPWNSYKQQIKTININDGVTSIGNYAFSNCSSLTSITIPNSVTSIGEDAFSSCSSLTSITIPNSVTSIGINAFLGCSTLTSITIPNSVTSIGNSTFSNCSSLTSITIPNSVTSIGYHAFSNCSSLTSIEVNADNPNYTSIDGVLYDKDVTILICCPGGKTSITIPNSVTSIGENAFYFCSSLTSITIPNSVTSIEYSAFYGCSSLTSITIPNSVTSIGIYAFYNCSGLTSVTIPNSVTSIEYSAFYGCSSLASITIPNSVTSIGNYAFGGCSGLTSITMEATAPPTIISNTFKNVSKNIPVTVPCGSLSAYQSAEYWSEFTNYVEEFPYTFSATTADATMGSVTIETAPSCGVDAVIKATPKTGYAFEKWSDGNTDNPRTITVTQDTLFTAQFKKDLIASGTCGDNLTWQLTKDGVLTISGTGKMYDYNSSDQPWNSYKQQIKTININDGVTSIGNSAFSWCESLTSISIPNSVTEIGEGAFSSCSSLTSITIPNSVTSIGERVFYFCTSLTSITIPNSVTSIGNEAFYYCSSLASITIGNSVTSIGNYAFSYCKALTSITIPNSVTSIGNSAFSSCDALTSITIGNSVTSIGNYAFASCTSLTSITIPNSVTSIGEWAFSWCSSLTSITIPNSVTSIGQYAFVGCSSLTSITIPNSVISIGDYAFNSCSSLTSIEVEANNPNYASIDGVLYDKDVTILICCPGGKTSITIPNSVTSIGDEAFSSCSSLTSITIPNSVTSIGSSAFSDCDALTSITIPNSVTSIGRYAFSGCSGLTSVTILNSITSIGEGIFSSCKALTSITIPNSVTSIGNYAFSYCSSLTSINIEATIPPTIGGAYTFNNVSKNILVIVPCGSLSAYQSAKYWSEFTNFRESFPYTFSATTADATMGSVTIETAPACGVDAVIKATPNAGYRFVKWSDGNTDNPRTITVTQNTSLTAQFKKNTKFVSVQPNNPTMGMVYFASGTNNAENEVGSSVTFIAVAKSGYTFKSWSDGVSDAMRTIVITEDISLTAIFEAPVVNYTLTLTADNTMGSVVGGGTYTQGTNITIVATPKAGYRFVKWSDGNTNATRTITVNADMTLSAVFEAIPTYIVTLTVNSQMGSVSGGGTFEVGKSTTISAVAKDGYKFKKWSDGNTANPRTITVNQNISLEAIFEALYVNWSPSDNESSHSFVDKHYYDTITIPAGKTIIVEDKATIACNDIVIKADKNGNVPEIKVVGDIIANNGVTYEWQIDDTRWYFFSLPFNCKISDIEVATIANGPKDGVWNYYNPTDGSGDFIIRKYNQKNASNGQGKKTGWEDCKGNEMLHKGRGYIIGLFPGGSKAKVMFKSEKQESLSKLIEQQLDFGDDHSWFDYKDGDNALYNGWNLVGIPYFEAFDQGELDAAYVSIPNSDGMTYKQYTLNEALSKGLLRPFMSFFIQLGNNVAPIFSPNSRSNAPMLREKANSVADEIIVKVHSAEDEELTDKTTIINNATLTAEYEIGHDLQKMVGYADQPQIYTIEECGILAFNAQDVSSRMSIRLGVYAPVDGEYVIGGEAWGDMADAMLYDNETYRSTSLIIPQTIYLEKGVHDERFEIKVQSASMPTDVENEMSDLEVMIEDGRLYVENIPTDATLYIYDMNGKLVHQQRTNAAIDYEFYAQGIYNITIYTDSNKVFNTKIVY